MLSFGAQFRVKGPGSFSVSVPFQGQIQLQPGKTGRLLELLEGLERSGSFHRARQNS